MELPFQIDLSNEVAVVTGGSGFVTGVILPVDGGFRCYLGV